MTAEFYNFSKRRNSTKTPSLAGTQKTIVLKENTSITSPSIVLSGHDFSYNYVYITEFGRYYFVNDMIVLDNNMTQYDLVEDVLASNITAIGNTKAMIIRSSSGYNVWIPDDHVYVSAQKTIARTVDETSVYFANSTGCYLVSVINEEGSYSNFAAQYYDNATGIQALAGQLMDNNIINDVLMYYNNVSNAIISLKWMPFDYTSVSSASGMTTLENIKIANHILSVGAYRITGSSIYVDGAVSVGIPWTYVWTC